ncbi:MAG: PepSY domain-containing protein [Tissierellaceae bacterium]|nr:PepSY domain-containing protein [Tissierellaceae bacterium]
MREHEILNHIKNSIDEAPIDLLDSIKSQPITKMMEHDDITKQEEKRVSIKPLMSLASLAAVFLFVFLSLYSQFLKVDSYIYIDVNPSIEIKTNKHNQVIELIAVNQDAIDIIKEIDYKRKDVYIVTEEIVNSYVNQQYLNENNDIILISVYNKDKDKSKKQVEDLNVAVNTHLEDVNLKPILLTQSLDKSSTIEEYAKKYGISVGKMTFIRNMIILNPELKTEELVNLSLFELIELANNEGINLEKVIESDDYNRLDTKDPVIDEDQDDFDEDIYELDDDEDDDNDDDDDDEKDVAADQKPDRKIDIISSSKAKEIALSLVNGNIKELKLDEDDDHLIYKIEIKENGNDHEIKIDAYTGKVLKFESEYDNDDEDDDDDDDNQNQPKNTKNNKNDSKNKKNNK